MKDDHIRPDPDAILARLKAEEDQARYGRLKIFLGYVAGVGKTYAMLEAAHQRKSEKVDVVVGYVETHSRAETEKLLAGLEIIPRKQVEYRGTNLSEMDLDAVLARHPQLVLVDELAHTNAPGSRHAKRYQDVEELLAAGIDVYTTVNIQHLESLNDVVQQITDVRMRETVPDLVIDEAYEIEVIDLPPDELLQRLRNGKVYIPDQAARAIEKFFRKGNLTALREMALRRAAERVDTQMVSYMQQEAIPGPWAAGERILVSISSHPLAERLIRAGRKLADDLNAEWYVLFVETPGHMGMPERNRERVQRNMALAEELGGKTFTVSGESAADEIVRFAHEHNITKIIAGKPILPRWRELFQRSVINDIIRKSGRVDVYIISEDRPSMEKAAPSPFVPHKPLLRYLGALVLVAAATGISEIIRPYLHATNLVMVYLAAVVVVAVLWGRGPSMLASLISVLAFDFLFVTPRFSFAVEDTQYLITFLGLLLVGAIISNFASMLRNQVETLRRRDKQSQAVNSFSQELTGAATLDQVLDIVILNIGDVFGRDVVILLPEKNHLVQRSSSQGFKLDASELAVAEWCYKNGQPAGQGTDTLPAAAVRYVPLKTVRGVIGVLGVKLNDPKELRTADGKQFLASFTNLSALAIERARLAEESVQAELLRSTERLQTALLNSISHQLRTPLATITGVLTSLGMSERDQQGENRLDSATRLELIDSAIKQSEQLNRLVENLLDMTRLESGALHIHSEAGDLRDLIATVVDQMSAQLGERPVDIDVEDELPPVYMDTILTGQVLLNLIENAIKYSPENTPVRIAVCLRNDMAEVSVKDHGIGVPEEDLERIFDKFFRVQRPHQVAGTGLGLSICRGIVEAQGGRIWAANNPDGGLTVSFTLPTKPREEGGTPA